MASARIVPPSAPDRLRRLLWGMCWALLFRPSPVPFHGWRCLLLRLFGATVGKGAHPYPSARIWAPWRLVMEEGSCLGAGADCYNVAQVTLGRGCVVSQKAYLCTASHDVDDPAFPLVGAPISIGAGAWVAAAAFVGPGVTVGEGAVLGACAVVSRDVAQGAIMVGNPAQFLRQRQSFEVAP